MRNLVAVYGTLCKGGQNHEVINNSNTKFLGEDATHEITVYDVGLFPTAKLMKSKAGFVVEVYDVDDWCLKDIDKLEGYNNEEPENGLFDRVQIKTKYGDAWVYIYNPLIDPSFDEDWLVGV